MEKSVLRIRVSLNISLNKKQKNKKQQQQQWHLLIACQRISFPDLFKALCRPNQYLSIIQYQFIDVLYWSKRGQFKAFVTFSASAVTYASASILNMVFLSTFQKKRKIQCYKSSSPNGTLYYKSCQCHKKFGIFKKPCFWSY